MRKKLTYDDLYKLYVKAGISLESWTTVALRKLLPDQFDFRSHLNKLEKAKFDRIWDKALPKLSLDGMDSVTLGSIALGDGNDYFKKIWENPEILNKYRQAERTQSNLGFKIIFPKYEALNNQVNKIRKAINNFQEGDYPDW